MFLVALLRYFQASNFVLCVCVSMNRGVWNKPMTTTATNAYKKRKPVTLTSKRDLENVGWFSPARTR